MERRSGLELANDNAAAHWLAMAEVQGWETRTGAGWTAVRCEGDPGDSHRVVLTRPPADTGALTRELLSLFRDWETGGLCLEDPYAALDLSGHGCERSLPMPVMVRPGGVRIERAGTPGPDAVEVVQALAESELAVTERVVVEGFPVPTRMPLRRGRMFPPALNELAGRRSWLALRRGEAAGACVSWDDGTAVGLYWVAVLERHRSHGVARMLLEAALGAHPLRAATLTATLLGEPLYRKLGFVEQGVTSWWNYPATASQRPD
jgi:GNAT superfamily N-acetyltransferase